MKPNERMHVRIGVRVEKRLVEALDSVAASLGVKRATLVRMIIINYLASLQRVEVEPGVALARVTKAPAKLSAGVYAEPGEPTRADEAQPVVKKAAEEVVADG